MAFEKLAVPVDPKTLHRRGSPSTSRDAAYSIDTTALEQIVLGAVMMHPDGAIQDEVLRALKHKGLAYSSVTARFRSLLDKELLVETGEKRKGESGRHQRVLALATPELLASARARKEAEAAKKRQPVQPAAAEAAPEGKKPGQMTEEEASQAVSDRIDAIKKLMREVDEIGSHHDVYTVFYIGDVSIRYDSSESGWQSSY